MHLTSEAVHDLVKDCLFKEGEPKDDPVIVEGITRTFGFHPDRIRRNAPAIAALLAELPSEFRMNSGGGWSFLQACVDRHGNQWAEHPTMEELFVLGIASGQANWLLPRDMWSILPGGMPYVGISVADSAAT